MTGHPAVPEHLNLIGPVIGAIPVHRPVNDQDPAQWIVMCHRPDTDDYSTHRVYRGGFRGEEYLAEGGHYDLTYEQARRDMLERAGVLITKVIVTTLTVEDGEGGHASVHADRKAALDALRVNYGGDHLSGVSDDSLVQALNRQGLVIYIDEHTIEVGR